MQRSAVHAQEPPCYPNLRLQLFAQTVPAIVYALGGKLPTNDLHELIRKHSDEQVATDAALDVMVNRTQTELRLQAAEHRFQISRCPVLQYNAASSGRRSAALPG